MYTTSLAPVIHLYDTFVCRLCVQGYFDGYIAKTGANRSKASVLVSWMYISWDEWVWWRGLLDE